MDSRSGCRLFGRLKGYFPCIEVDIFGDPFLMLFCVTCFFVGICKNGNFIEIFGANIFKEREAIYPGFISL